MKDFNIASMKYSLLLFLVCFIFIIAVRHAFDYLPQNNSVNFDSEAYAKIKKSESYKQEISSDVYSKEKTNLEENSETENLTREENSKPYTIISEEDISLNKFYSDSSSDELRKKLEDIKRQGKTAESAQEYQTLIKSTEDKEIQADCYAELAKIYGKYNRYDSALKAAQKAYSLSPTVERELLLARVYFKSGNVDKTNEHIDKILRREF